MGDKRAVIPVERIEGHIFLIRGEKVMLSTHLAQHYDVEPRALVQAVKRNLERFPEDFMFQLNVEEFADLKSQIVTSSWGGTRRAAPYAFTEQGVAMLSSVLHSTRAVMVNEEEAFHRLLARGERTMRRLAEKPHKRQPDAVKADAAIAANLEELGYGG